MMNGKKCLSCLYVYPRTEDFFRGAYRGNGFSPDCLKCRGEKPETHEKIEEIRKAADRGETLTPTIICTKCGRELEQNKDYFDQSTRNLNGFSSVCKECLGRKFNIKPQIVKCTKCKEEKEFNSNNFHKSSRTKWGLRKICKECINKKRRKNNAI